MKAAVTLGGCSLLSPSSCFSAGVAQCCPDWSVDSWMCSAAWGWVLSGGAMGPLGLLAPLGSWMML